jgi:KUP system potassium uptake protein
MKADNQGEGGILALLALSKSKECCQNGSAETPWKKILVGMGLFGASLLYGDGIITPAISVLSAVEGLAVDGMPFAKQLSSLVAPLTCGILIALFLAQKKGTAGIGKVFGPVMLLWFCSITALGLPQIIKNPLVLQAVNPLYAIKFFHQHGFHGFLVLGAVVLCITGGEALYADMGHFGPKPIRFAWFVAVFPALLINYFGQGALLLTGSREALSNPFYALVPKALLIPMILLATVATVVASQALISGAFSLTQQAMQLGYFPRMQIVHTSGDAEGQIYVPAINNILMVACLALVWVAKSSAALAAAYGIAVTGTMSITTILFADVARNLWRWSAFRTYLLTGLFLIIDLTFFAANAVKIAQGGWFPLMVAIMIFYIMTTWKKGRAALNEKISEGSIEVENFVASLSNKNNRIPGTAIVMTSNPGKTPGVLLHAVKHFRNVPGKLGLLTICTDRVPEVQNEDRIQITNLGNGIFQIIVHYGFMENPDMQQIIQLIGKTENCFATIQNISFILGRVTLVMNGGSGMSWLGKWVFAILTRLSLNPTMFYGIPPNRVVELGTQIVL